MAVAALLQLEPGVAPNTGDSVPFKRAVVSSLRQLYRFELTDLHHIDEITVQRLRWRNPQTGKRELIGAWWATKAILSECETPGQTH